MDPERAARERADYVVREAEASKARMLQVPGNENSPNLGINENMSTGMGDLQHHVVANYIEDSLRMRIENGEYVDFARLLPRNRVLLEEDTRMELVNKNGHTYFVPASSHGSADSAVISSFSRWEQAFRVFSNIFTNRFPHRSSELIQYNHIIYTAALSFSWDNVYLYDKEFRLHMARFPQRSWAIILQQAWTMRMKDRLRYDNNQGKNGDRKSQKKDICWRYNRGKCTYGAGCKFEHKCAICNKFGHGAHICRKANQRFDYDKKDSWDRWDKNDRGGRGNDDRDKFNKGRQQIAART